MNDLTTVGSGDIDSIRSRILTIRGVQVMLDRDLAELYGVPTKRLNEQVKRNARRFPESFKMASRIAVLTNLLGGVPAWNCKSGKDRTGM